MNYILFLAISMGLICGNNLAMDEKEKKIRQCLQEKGLGHFVEKTGVVKTLMQGNDPDIAFRHALEKYAEILSQTSDPHSRTTKNILTTLYLRKDAFLECACQK